MDADSWVPPAGCCCAVGAGHFKKLKFGCWLVGSGCWKCLGVSRGAPAVAGQRLWDFGNTHLAPSPLPQSVQEFHEDLFPDCMGTLPATNAQGWWAGDSQQVSVIRGGVLAGGTATAPCPPLCSMQVGRVSLHPARRPTETFTSPIIAGTSPTSTGHTDTDTGHTDADTGHTDADQSVSMGRWKSALNAEGVGSLLPSSHTARLSVALSPIGSQWLLLTILTGLTRQHGHLALSQHRPLQWLCQQPQPEVPAEHFG